MNQKQAIKLLDSVRDGDKSATYNQITIALMKTGDLIVPQLKLSELQKVKT